jgi:hypothetical protein
MDAQITIHNVKITETSKKRAVLSIKASELPGYLDKIKNEGNSVFNPNNAQKFESFPLLKVVDSFDTMEEFVFQTVEDLPTESLFNSKKDPVLFILPESCSIKVGLNLIAPAKSVKQNAVNDKEANERT